MRFLAFIFCFFVATTMVNASQKLNQPQKMQFTVAHSGGNCSGCVWIAAVGVIDIDAPKRFTELINKNPHIDIVYIHSLGGSLFAGMELGKIFRAKKIKVYIYETKSDEYSYSYGDSGVCMSACAYAFLGGIARVIPQNSQLGYHQFYSERNTPSLSLDSSSINYKISKDQIISGLIASYLVEMGVDARVLTIASSVDKNDVAILSTDDLRYFNITTTDIFTNWRLEVTGKGLVALTEKSNSYSLERSIMAFCTEPNHESYLVFITARPQNYGSSINSTNLSSYLKRLELKSDQTILYSAHSSQIQYYITDKLFLFALPIPNQIKDDILNTPLLFVDFDVPRAFFGTWPNFNLVIDAKTKEILRFAWKNCGIKFPSPTQLSTLLSPL